MNIRLKHISVSILFILAAAHASADPRGDRRGDWEFVRAFQLQKIAVDRGDQRNESRIVAPDERRRSAEYGRQDSSGYESQGDGQSNNASENSRKQGRMSPEERRALRRQIDEAGHDIYRPKR